MLIFDDVQRADIEPAGHLVGGFEYLNASARDEATRVRAFLEHMISNYPEPNRDELVRRIRSRDERAHRSAVFELTLHHLLLQRGFNVVEIEPEMVNGRAPDFLVEAPDRRRFYLEATTAWGELGGDAGADRRRRDAMQAIDNVASPDFFLGLHTRGTPITPVPIGRLRRAVQRFVDGLDYDAVVADIENNRQAPIYQEDLNGLHILIEPIPKNLRGTGGRAVGTRMLPGGVVRSHEAIADAVRRKASRYGDLDLPYIVAVNSIDTFANRDSAIDALFGTEAVVVHPEGHEWVRNPDGVWRNQAGPTHTRVSAVLSTERFSAWDIGQRAPRLVLNPWAANPLGDVPLGLEVLRVENDRLLATGGATLGALFGLADGWPER